MQTGSLFFTGAISFTDKPEEAEKDYESIAIYGSGVKQQKLNDLVKELSGLRISRLGIVGQAHFPADTIVY